MNSEATVGRYRCYCRLLWVQNKVNSCSWYYGSYVHTGGGRKVDNWQPENQAIQQRTDGPCQYSNEWRCI